MILQGQSKKGGVSRSFFY